MKKKLIDHVRARMKAYALDQIPKLEQSAGPLEYCNLVWSEQGPFTVRFFNLYLSGRTKAGKFVNNLPSPSSVPGDDIGVDIDKVESIIRRFKSEHPAEERFFVTGWNGYESEVDDETRQSVAAWFEREESQYAGLCDEGSAFEFDALLHVVIDSLWKDLEEEILEETGVACEIRPDEDGPLTDLEFVADDLAAIRAANDYHPGVDFVRQYLSLFTDDAALAERWAKAWVEGEE